MSEVLIEVRGVKPRRVVRSWRNRRRPYTVIVGLEARTITATSASIALREFLTDKTVKNRVFTGLKAQVWCPPIVHRRRAPTRLL